VNPRVSVKTIYASVQVFLQKQEDALHMVFCRHGEVTAWGQVHLLLHSILKHISVFVSFLSCLEFPASCPYSSSL